MILVSARFNNERHSMPLDEYIMLNQDIDMRRHLQKYIDFLSAGSSVNPIELLKTVDVDITKKETLTEAFKLYNQLLDTFEELTKEK